MTDEQFSTFFLSNEAFIIERLASGEITISDSTPFLKSDLHRKITHTLQRWNSQAEQGIVVTNGAFVLQTKAVRKPQLAWMQKNNISQHDISQSQLIARVPDFVVEIKKPFDDLKFVKARMREWIASGCKLCWLIDERKQVVYIFEKAKVRMQIGFDRTIYGDPVLRGFEIRLDDKNQDVKSLTENYPI